MPINIIGLRNKIEKIDFKPARMCVKYLYLIDGRISEAISKRAPSDVKTTPRGPQGRSLSIQDYEEGGEVALFSVNTAKREGFLRICALPIERQYEPWTKEVVKYFGKFNPNEYVFPYNRQKIWHEAREVWGSLSYPIESYEVVETDEYGNVVLSENGSKVKRRVNRHIRDFNLHAIRHIRATDLVVFYGFNGPNLSAFGGWTLSTAMNVSGSIDRYVQLDWRSYYPKLLKRRY